MKLTFCGSTKFKEQYLKWNLVLSKVGHIIYSVAGFGHSGDELTENEKSMLDLVHLRKIVESDAIFVLDCEYEGKPYVGASTTREIFWAQMNNKPVYFYSKSTDVCKLLAMLYPQ